MLKLHQNHKIIASDCKLFEPHRRLDHNMLDTQFLNCIAQSWSASLREFDIDVRSSYRNLRFEFGQRTSRVQLEWSQFNDSQGSHHINLRFSKNTCLVNILTKDVEIQKLMYGSESSPNHNGVTIYFAITTITLVLLLFY